MRSHLQRVRLQRHVKVVSAGTHVASPGRKPDPRVIAIAAENEVRVGRIRARQITRRIAINSQNIWVMEDSHRRALLQEYPELEDRIELLDPSGTDIPDPYFANKASVRRTYERINQILAERVVLLRRSLET